MSLRRLHITPPKKQDLSSTHEPFTQNIKPVNILCRLLCSVSGRRVSVAFMYVCFFHRCCPNAINASETAQIRGKRCNFQRQYFPVFPSRTNNHRISEFFFYLRHCKSLALIIHMSARRQRLVFKGDIIDWLLLLKA